MPDAVPPPRLVDLNYGDLLLPVPPAFCDEGRALETDDFGALSSVCDSPSSTQGAAGEADGRDVSRLSSMLRLTEISQLQIEALNTITYLARVTPAALSQSITALCMDIKFLL